MGNNRMVKKGNMKEQENYNELQAEFVQKVLTQLDDVRSEIEERNQNIEKNDKYIYGKQLEQSIDIPVGHDITPVNWLKRGVEIHRDQFMGRGFTVTSTYDAQDISKYDHDPEEQERTIIENGKQMEYAERRQRLIDGIIRDNGGYQLFKDLAEDAGSIGNAVVKGYYDEKAKKYVLSQVESVENFYVVWQNDDFRKANLNVYINQVSKHDTLKMYPKLPQDIETAPLGSPLKYTTEQPDGNFGTQPMVTHIEATGIIPGFKSKNGRLSECEFGKENQVNVRIVGKTIVSLIDDEKKVPNYYILPNKRRRRRAWGEADITDTAIEINRTYIETLSDWRTLANKVNFPKIKAFNFPNGASIPKPKSRAVEILAMGEGQDLQLLNLGDANQFDFRAQLDELKEQFVREVGISRVFFDDPSVTLNSNQALMTAIKPTTDIAEAKKAIWGPILTEMFRDALTTIALYDKDVKEIIVEDEYELNLMWPSVLQKEDPVYQQMLLNRFNSNTISLQSYLEAQGETKEEADRIKTELQDVVSAAILGKQVGALAQLHIQSYQQDQMASQQQGQQEDVRQQVATQGENQEGMGVQSQPGSGAPPVGMEGALAMQNQQQGF